MKPGTAKPLFIILLLAATFLSCKKLVEDTKKDILLGIITDGQWHIETFLEATDSNTSRFERYNFKFKEDGSVYGIKDSVSIVGFWEGDINNYSIISAFPETAEPLQKLNGTWKIRDSSLDYVAAEMTTLQGMMILHLRKNG